MRGDSLETIREGDTLSADHANQVRRLLGRRITGQGVTETADGWAIRRPRRAITGFQMRLVRIILVLEFVLRAQEIEMLTGTTWRSIGETFPVYPWPGQTFEDYTDKSPIVMIAFKVNGFWLVQMTGDRLYAPFPEEFCDSCQL